MLQQYKVKQILGQPENQKLRFDKEGAIEYYSLLVELESVERQGNYFETMLTFDKLHKAHELKVGDVFDR